ECGEQRPENVVSVAGARVTDEDHPCMYTRSYAFGPRPSGIGSHLTGHPDESRAGLAEACPHRSRPRRLRPHRGQRVMPEDEQRPPIRAAEYQLDRTLGQVDAADRLSVAVVDEDLPVRHVDVPRAVGDDALTAAIGERLETAERAVRLHGCAIRAGLGAADDVDA